MSRKIPRDFNYAWGSGQVVEEASAPNGFYEPVIQLLQVQDGEHTGEDHLRFCFYSPKGAFQRHPLVISEEDIDQLRQALASTPRISELLRRLVADQAGREEK